MYETRKRLTRPDFDILKLLFPVKNSSDKPKIGTANIWVDMLLRSSTNDLLNLF